MSGVWPNLDAADLEARCRIYLNEATAGFFTQAEIWRWLSVGVKDISEKSLCVRRILDAQTVASARTVNFTAYKVIHVEYIPATGRPMMLRKIDPLRVGHIPNKGTAPQRWYEFGTSIGIDPVPDGIYELRLYVAGVAKMVVLTFSSFTAGAGATEWTAGAGWTGGTAAAHTGASSDLTYNTVLSASSNYTLEFTASGIGTGGSVTPYAGTTAGVPVTANGPHTQTIVSSAGSPALKFTGVQAVTIDDLTVHKEADYAAVGDQTELPTAWQHLLALYATHGGLMKDKRYGPARMLESIYQGEMAYLRANIVEVIPDGRNSLADQ